ncbi:hypothetical protein LOC68_11085 [Blastopirellula sp. JC732]|uniref:Uncharacterized protein n=1 Tax=Blastopirellula sediminis TaxID=2894196 RepID=A0A9X1MKQ0_9BACT|nr:hypothetical protein [Blastopirellula sediminis]MCC9608272.1 hypothetical protein [Blastopirellula sediminis]MCC9628943.1 hypothetical protein [Blastopirellula sediminis]
MAETPDITDSWCQHIPLLHRIVSGATPASQFPEPARTTELFAACAVWETLHYALKYLLGWQRPGDGLAWWYGAGKPVEDSPLLGIVSEIWDRAGELDYYAAYVWRIESPDHAVYTSDLAKSMAAVSSNSDEQWWRDLLRRKDTTWLNPFDGGGNSLHLGHSDWFGSDEPETDRAELYHNPKTRRAVLVVNQIGAWRHDLKRAESQLPDLGDRSWHVRVVDPRYGCLGTFRRSRVTGLWFQGKHSIHLRGNPSKPDSP